MEEATGLAVQSTSQIAEIRAAASVLIERMQFLRQAGISFKGERDLYEILGYERLLTNRDFRDRYARGGIAGRIVDAFPKATWRGGWELIEDEDPQTDTKFEKTWRELANRLKIGAVLQRADILAGLSTYAVVLIGAKGSANLDEELPRGNPDDLLYLTPFSGGGGPGASQRRSMTIDADATIQTYVTDTSDERFGLPLTYSLKRTDFSVPTFVKTVHWTRVIHIAEGILDDEVFGQPALERVWNLLDDLDKVTGGGAEAFWLRANQGLQLDIDKEMDMTPEEKEALKTQADEYQHQIRRMLRTRGVSVNTLGSDVANFSNPADAVLTQIAGSKGIPKRILTGSEMGELASSQDRDNWKDQVNGRQTEYAGPYIVRPLVDRLIKFGYLPTPKKGPTAYEVRWPHIQVLTEQEKYQGAQAWASANQTAGKPVFTVDEIRDRWYGFEPLTEEQIAKELPPAPPEVPGGELPPTEEEIDPETGLPLASLDPDIASFVAPKDAPKSLPRAAAALPEGSEKIDSVVVPLSKDEIFSLAETIDADWKVGEKGLTRVFNFADRRMCASFIQQIAKDANSANHHPDIVMDGDSVEISYTTHSVGDKLTKLDFEAAARADALALPLRAAGGPGSGPQKGQGSGRVPYSPFPSDYGFTDPAVRAKLADHFVELHNSASKEYKEAFAKVGAKMWRDDYAHPLTGENADFIKDHVAKSTPNAIKSIYTITRPLTMLDSYPNVPASKREILDKDVDRIFNKYQHQWTRTIKTLGGPGSGPNPGGGSRDNGGDDDDSVKFDNRELRHNWTEGSRATQSKMSDPTTPEGEEFSKYLDTLPKVDGTFYRGMVVTSENFEKMKSDTSYNLTKHSSSSDNKDIAEGFLGEQSGSEDGVLVLLKIEGSGRKLTSAEDDLEDEGEVVLLAGTQYERVSFEKMKSVEDSWQITYREKKIPKTLGGPGSGPHPGPARTTSDVRKANNLSATANALSQKAVKSGNKEDHIAAANAHQIAARSQSGLGLSMIASDHAVQARMHLDETKSEADHVAAVEQRIRENNGDIEEREDQMNLSRIPADRLQDEIKYAEKGGGDDVTIKIPSGSEFSMSLKEAKAVLKEITKHRGRHLETTEQELYVLGGPGSGPRDQGKGRKPGIGRQPAAIKPSGIKQKFSKDGRPVPIITTSIEEAILLVHEGLVVQVRDVKEAHTLIERLAALATAAQAAGKDAKDYDLCQVSVAGSNMFCSESLRSEKYPDGVPRLEMPQLGGLTVPGSEADNLKKDEEGKVNGAEAFKDHLKSLGIDISSENVKSSSLKASQRELIGSKVAGMMARMEKEREGKKSDNKEKNAIFVSSDNYVIDGHHRWAASVGKDAADGRLGDSKMHIIRVDSPISEILQIANKWGKEFGIKQVAGVKKEKKEREAKGKKLKTAAERWAETHKFSSTQVNLPSSVANKILTFAAEIPDEDLAEDGRETTPHVTVKYGIHTYDPGQIREIVEGFGPITLSFGPLSYFPNTESNHGDVIYVDILSPDLERLNTLLSTSLEVTDTHPKYRPHATIAYVETGLGEFYTSDPYHELFGQSVTINEIEFSTPDDERTVINLLDEITEEQREIVLTLEAAIQTNNTEIIDKIIGTKHSLVSAPVEKEVEDVKVLEIRQLTEQTKKLQDALEKQIPTTLEAVENPMSAEIRALIESVKLLAARETPVPRKKITRVERDEKGLLKSFVTEEDNA